MRGCINHRVTFTSDPVSCALRFWIRAVLMLLYAKRDNSLMFTLDL